MPSDQSFAAFLATDREGLDENFLSRLPAPPLV